VVAPKHLNCGASERKSAGVGKNLTGNTAKQAQPECREPSCLTFPAASNTEAVRVRVPPALAVVGAVKVVVYGTVVSVATVAPFN